MGKIAVVLVCFSACLHKVIHVVHELLGQPSYGRGGHLGHLTSIMSSDFLFLVPESFHTKFGSDRYSNF